MRARSITRMILFAALVCFAASASVLADSIEVQYQASNVSGNEWSYSYTIIDTAPFVANEALTVFFSGTAFANLDSSPVSPNGWFVFTLQPDLTLPQDGLYTALALTDGATLTGPFTINFDFLETGAPGSQNFSVDQFDADGNLIGNVATGVTTPLSAGVPEPATGVLLLVGAAAFGVLRKRFPRESREH